MSLGPLIRILGARLGVFSVLAAVGLLATKQLIWAIFSSPVDQPWLSFLWHTLIICVWLVWCIQMALSSAVFLRTTAHTAVGWFSVFYSPSRLAAAMILAMCTTGGMITLMARTHPEMSMCGTHIDAEHDRSIRPADDSFASDWVLSSASGHAVDTVAAGSDGDVWIGLCLPAAVVGTLVASVAVGITAAVWALLPADPATEPAVHLRVSAAGASTRWMPSLTAAGCTELGSSSSVSARLQSQLTAAALRARASTAVFGAVAAAGLAVAVMLGVVSPGLVATPGDWAMAVLPSPATGRAIGLYNPLAATLRVPSACVLALAWAGLLGAGMTAAARVLYSVAAAGALAGGKGSALLAAIRAAANPKRATASSSWTKAHTFYAYAGVQEPKRLKEDDSVLVRGLVDLQTGMNTAAAGSVLHALLSWTPSKSCATDPATSMPHAWQDRIKDVVHSLDQEELKPAAAHLQMLLFGHAHAHAAHPLAAPAVRAVAWQGLVSACQAEPKLFSLLWHNPPQELLAGLAAAACAVLDAHSLACGMLVQCAREEQFTAPPSWHAVARGARACTWQAQPLRALVRWAWLDDVPAGPGIHIGWRAMLLAAMSGQWSSCMAAAKLLGDMSHAGAEQSAAIPVRQAALLSLGTQVAALEALGLAAVEHDHAERVGTAAAVSEFLLSVPQLGAVYDAARQGLKLASGSSSNAQLTTLLAEPAMPSATRAVIARSAAHTKLRVRHRTWDPLNPVVIHRHAPKSTAQPSEQASSQSASAGLGQSWASCDSGPTWMESSGVQDLRGLGDSWLTSQASQVPTSPGMPPVPQL